MVEVRFDKKFITIFSKIKDHLLKEKIKKQIEKIIKNPLIGKPMRFGRKGSRELYIKPYRLSYIFINKDQIVFILDLYNKKHQ